jgi:hypothetical protein
MDRYYKKSYEFISWRDGFAMMAAKAAVAYSMVAAWAAAKEIHKRNPLVTGATVEFRTMHIRNTSHAHPCLTTEQRGRAVRNGPQSCLHTDVEAVP